MGGVFWVDRGPQLACWGSEGFSHALEEGLMFFLFGLLNAFRVSLGLKSGSYCGHVLN